MKKSKFFVIMLVLLSFGLFTACNSKASIKGDFKNSEYTISLSSEISFLNELSVIGVDLKDVKFVSSNEKILAPKTEGVFEGVDSGDAYVFARINDKNIAKTKVNVKYKFSQPKNLKMIDGVFTFDPSYIIKGGKQICAQRYQLKYKIDDGEEQTLILENGERSYTFTQKGIYSITLNALSDSEEKIDSSEEKSGLFTLGVMLPVRDFGYTCSNELSQIAQFTWQSDEEHVLFDVYIDGLRIESDLTKGEFTYNFAPYQENANITIKIVSKDGEGKRDNTSQEFDFNVLSIPQAEYVYQENGDGYISWNNDLKATKYVISFYDENTFRRQYHEINQGEKLEEYLSELPEGIYRVNVAAVGGSKNGQNYLNSKPSEDIEVGKLAIKKPDVKFEGNTAKIKFQQDAYITKYKISCEGRSMVYDVAQGDTASFDLSFLSVGEHNLQFTALPTPDENSETKVKVFQYRSKAVMRVINSDVLDYQIYKLGNFGSITHKLRENTSILTFSAIANANYYQVYVNDQFVKNFSSSSTDTVTIEFENLNNYQPNERNEYDIKLIAGRKEGEVDIAILSEGHKSLKILPIVTQNETQTNGYFAWNALAEPCQYRYVIYKTDSDYSEAVREQIGQPTTTSGTKIVNELEEGYYVIEIVSLTTNADNYNNYLNSNFKDSEGGVASFQFKVTQRIEAPEVTFSEEGGLHLDIKVKEFTGKVTIYIDGEPIENPPFEEVKEEVTYYFEFRFEEAKCYELQVVSSGGTLYDNDIYTDSDPLQATINVTRIAQPTIIEVEDKFDKVDKNFNSQLLYIEDCDGSENAIVKLNDAEKETQKLEKGYALDLFDQAVYGENFNLNITLKAKEGEGNNYYISSIPKDYKFRRITAPNSLKYQNGKITWVNTDDATADYYISVIIVDSKTTNYSKRFFLGNLDTQFDFQTFVNENKASDEKFANAYNQKEKIDIELIAYKNGYEDDTYVLFSANANTFMGEGTLHIETLNPTSLSFDTESEKISWESVREGCIYDIYVDGEIVKEKEGYTSLSITKDEIAEDYLIEKKVQVMARHPEQLNSELSDPIYIKKLTPPSKATIGITLGQYNLTIPLTDTTHTKSVSLNGENIEFSTGDINAYKELTDEKDEQVIVFVALNDGGNHYYLDSDKVTITLKNLSDLGEAQFEGGINENELYWTELCKDMENYSVWPLQYELKIVDADDRTYYLYYDNEHSLELENLEQEVFEKCGGAKLTGSVKVTIKATIYKDYEITFGNNNVIYYNSCQSGVANTDKLEGVGNSLTITMVDADDQVRKIDQKLQSQLKFTFKDIWTSQYPEGITFKLNFENFKLPNEQTDLVLNASGGPNTIYYSFKKVGDNFEFLLNIHYLSAEFGEESTFKPGVSKFTIQVCRSGSINSDVEEKTIQRFEVPRGIQIDEDGMLTINEMAGASFLVEVKCGDMVSENELENSTSLDLMNENILKNRSGKYEIRILAYDKDSHTLPSALVVKEGHKLAGIKSVDIDECGIINIRVEPDENLKEDFVFEARENGIVKNFVPTEDLENQGLYHFSLLDMLYVFDETLSRSEGEQTMEMTVRIAGSIKADYTQLKFNYKTTNEKARLKRISSLDKDYIVYNIDNDITTTGFVVDITYTNYIEPITDDEETDEGEDAPWEPQAVTVRKLILAEQVKGFWVIQNEGDKGDFAKEKSSNGNTYTECYAICLDDILSEIEGEIGGAIKVKVSRVGKSGADIYQFSPTNFNELYHLNEPDYAFVSNNYLNIEWNNKIENGKTPSQYVIYFNVEDRNVARHYSTSASVDLRQFDFIQSENNYTVYVKAISFGDDNNVIGSSVIGGAMFKKYHEPIPLEIVDGKLMFEKETFKASKFVTDIESVANSGEQYYKFLTTKSSSYSGPIDFNIDNLASQKVILKLTKTISNETYQMSVPAYKLFPDVSVYVSEREQSYIDILTNTRNSLQQLQDTDPDAKIVFTMLDLITNASQGIGDDGDLFDDPLNGGKTIPAGEYTLTLYQSGYSNSIESEECHSKPLKVYVSPAPTFELKEEKDENGRANYYAIFRAEDTMCKNGDAYVVQTATAFKMVLRRVQDGYPSSKGRIELKIEKDNSGWHLYLSDNVINDVIEPTDDGFRMNMTKLKKEITGLMTSSVGGENDTKLRFNEELRVDVYVCGEDDGFVINGKSATFNLTYLDLSSSNIQFKDGVINVNADVNRDFKLLVKYKHEEGEETSNVLSFNSMGATTINFEKAGRYQYILVSLSGSFTKDSLVVESSTYLIAGKVGDSGIREGVYKLDLPKLSTTDNKLNIEYNENDIINTSELRFFMGNDISLDPAYGSQENETDVGYYYRSTIQDKTKVEPYVVGGLNLQSLPEYPSELKATKFYAYLGGNDGSFKVEPCEDFENAEYILKLYFNEEEISPILKSNESTISARMLPRANGFGIDEGNISIYYDDQSAPKVYNKVGADKEEGALIYEIRVLYYLSEGVEESVVKEQVYYSEISPLSTTFPGLTFDTTYEFYRMRITILAAKTATKETPNAELSMQGNYYLIKDGVYFEDGAQALMSQTLFTSVFTKTRTPRLEGSGVRKGEISFIIDRTVYFENQRPNPDKSYINEDTQKRITIFADYRTSKGEDKKDVKLDGEFTFNQSTVEADKITVTFVPNDGQLNDSSGGAISLRIYTYGREAIISSPLRISGVYKLANITEDLYDVNLEGENTVIDFSKYFKETQIGGNNSCFKITVDIVDEEEKTTSYEYMENSGNKKLTIQPKFKKLTMRVVDNQDNTETNARKLLFSDRNILNIEVTSTEGLTFKWNDTYKRFEWQWEEETLNKEYFISMRIGGLLETESVTTSYYMPKKMGKIPAQSVWLRMRNIGEQKNTLYIYSERVAYEGEDLNYNLFAAGEGSVSSPYEIRTKENFMNMAIRNDTNINFKIMVSDLAFKVSEMQVEDEVESRLFDSFRATLDGGNNIITIESDIVFTAEEENFPLVGYSELKFSKYSSLFKKIENGGAISNLVINYSINYTKLKGDNILFAPLVYENAGLIKNVVLNTISINIDRDKEGDGLNTVFIGGIACINTGKIENCRNSANVEYETPQMLNVNIAFAGIALFNRLGAGVNYIKSSINEGDISITTTSTLSSTLHIAGITLLNDGGKLSYCGNDGAITFDATRNNIINCFGGGIVISSANGTHEFLYNNGEIKAEKGNKNVGGVAYSISQGSVNTLVDTVYGQKVVANVTPQVDDWGTNYGTSGSSTSGLQVTDIKETTIEGDGISLQILIKDDKYVAKFLY